MANAMTNVKQLIIEEVSDIIANKKMPIPQISGKTHFFNDLPIDSLDLATLLIALEMKLEQDPFREGFKTFHTIEELTNLYRVPI